MKLKSTRIFSRRSQEEMIGFALIIIIVAVIILVLLGFSLRSSKKETIESYEAESFIQAFLQFTTDCEDSLGYYSYLSIQRLIFKCNNGEQCEDGRDTCEALNSTIKDILNESWKIKETPIKGYEFNILTNSQKMINIKEGNETLNYKGALQEFSKGGNLAQISLKIFY